MESFFPFRRQKRTLIEESCRREFLATPVFSRDSLPCFEYLLSLDACFCKLRQQSLPQSSLQSPVFIHLFFFTPRSAQNPSPLFLFSFLHLSFNPSRSEASFGSRTTAFDSPRFYIFLFILVTFLGLVVIIAVVDIRYPFYSSIWSLLLLVLFSSHWTSNGAPFGPTFVLCLTDIFHWNMAPPKVRPSTPSMDFPLSRILHSFNYLSFFRPFRSTLPPLFFRLSTFKPENRCVAHYVNNLHQLCDQFLLLYSSLRPLLSLHILSLSPFFRFDHRDASRSLPLPSRPSMPSFSSRPLKHYTRLVCYPYFPHSATAFLRALRPPFSPRLPPLPRLWQPRGSSLLVEVGRRSHAIFCPSFTPSFNFPPTPSPSQTGRILFFRIFA